MEVCQRRCSSKREGCRVDLAARTVCEESGSSSHTSTLCCSTAVHEGTTPSPRTNCHRLQDCTCNRNGVYIDMQIICVCEDVNSLERGSKPFTPESWHVTFLPDRLTYIPSHVECRAPFNLWFACLVLGSCGFLLSILCWRSLECSECDAPSHPRTRLTVQHAVSSAHIQWTE